MIFEMITPAKIARLKVGQSKNWEVNGNPGKNAVKTVVFEDS